MSSPDSLSGNEPAPSLFKTWLPVVLFSILWVDLIRLLSGPWDTREEYAYGWFVPFLAAGLLWRRWVDRPVPGPAIRGSIVNGLLFLLLLALLPLRVVCEINRDWPLVSWVYTATVVGITLSGFLIAGGRSWVRHFAFPVCLILVAVVWPHRLEKGLTQGLMQVVAGLTVELLGWFNIPALQRGNLIEIGVGVLGVDEACSGIRSFQSSLMAALFLGELYRLRLLPRVALVGCGLVLAFGFNVVRTFLLSWQANAHGMSAIDKWHDPAGMTIAIACFLGLWAIAGLIKARTQTAAASGPRPPISDLKPSPGFRPYLLAVGCWTVFCLLITEGWYWAHEPKNPGRFRWTAALPESKPAFSKIEMTSRTLKLLNYDVGATGRWSEADGSEWTLYFFRWNPTSANAIFRARQHRPDVCLPAAGLRLAEDHGVALFSVGDLRIPFHRYIYESDGRTLHVFFSQWEDGDGEQTGLAGSEQSGRVMTALKGRRHLGQQSLEFILSGYRSLDEASHALATNLPALVQVEAPVLPGDTAQN